MKVTFLFFTIVATFSILYVDKSYVKNVSSQDMWISIIGNA